MPSGYNTAADMAAELKDPGRVLPRSIIYSVTGIMIACLAMNIGVLGVVPWHTAAHSQSIASLVLERTWGKTAADITTVLIVVTAVGSVFAGLLGGSRVPYNAARDGLFFRAFGRMHPDHLLARGTRRGTARLLRMGEARATMAVRAQSDR
jgi:fructoselysine transporter